MSLKGTALTLCVYHLSQVLSYGYDAYFSTLAPAAYGQSAVIPQVLPGARHLFHLFAMPITSFTNQYFLSTARAVPADELQ